MPEIDNREERKQVYTTVIERMNAMIRRGELKPGARLPPERKLAELLGVSRSNLRQAFQALAERKIIASRQGSGTYLLTALDSLMPADVIIDTISQQPGLVAHVLEFRQMLEPQIAALAARRLTRAELDRLKVLVCDQQRALLAGQEDGDFDAAFHRQLVVSAGNPVVAQMMAAVEPILNTTRASRLQSEGRRQASVEGHLRIIDALEAGDTQAASRAMAGHLAEIGQHLLGGPPPESCEQYPAAVSQRLTGNDNNTVSV